MFARDFTPDNYQELYRAYNDLEDLFTGFVKAMVNALDAKSPWTRGHSERVAVFAQEIAVEMGLPDEHISMITFAALLHDIGKIVTHGTLLDKKETLSDDEFELIKLHPVQGAEILKVISHFGPVIDIIRHHHEKIDGTGYPGGLRGNDIPIGARIVFVADAFDTMTENRPYRPALSLEYAIDELRRNAGTQFDTDVVRAWLRVLDSQRDMLSVFKNIASHESAP